MRVDVLQAVALCCHGNPYLASGEGEAPELVGLNRTFASVEELVFERRMASVSDRAAPTPVAGGVAPWLRRLQHEGVKRLELRLAKCAYDSARGEQGEWGILTDGDIGLELWQPAWKSKIGAFGEQPTWRVRYTSERTERSTAPNTPTIAKARFLIGLALCGALAFCVDAGYSAMRVALEKCLEMHKAGSLECPGFQDLAPASLSDEGHRLLASATRNLIVLASSAWDRSAVPQHVIGGFELTSQLLWKCTLTALETAVNTVTPIAESQRLAG